MPTETQMNAMLGYYQIRTELISEDGIEAMRASIQEHGIITPILKDQHGHIIDGHHRERIAKELGIEYPVHTVTVRDTAHARELALDCNSIGCPITAENRVEIIKALRRKGRSTRDIAAVVRVSKSQVSRDLAEAPVPCGTPDQPNTVTGHDGKVYPATREEKIEKTTAERRSLVPQMRQNGLSNVAIAKEFGVSEMAIRRDFKVLKEKETTAAPSTVLTVSETSRLDVYESTIAAGLQTFVEVGKALQAIRQDDTGSMVKEQMELDHLKECWCATTSTVRAAFTEWLRKGDGS